MTKDRLWLLAKMTLNLSQNTFNLGQGIFDPLALSQRDLDSFLRCLGLLDDKDISAYFSRM